jgi:hypothetical protein
LFPQFRQLQTKKRTCGGSLEKISAARAAIMSTIPSDGRCYRCTFAPASTAPAVRLVRLGSLQRFLQRLRSCRIRPVDTDDGGDFDERRACVDRATIERGRTCVGQSWRSLLFQS